MMDGTFKHYGRPAGSGLKLHLGCGDYWFDGFINIDHAILGGTDMILDLTQKLPFQDKVVAEIQAHEFVEHFTRTQIDSMLEDWKRVLIDGGVIHVTVPDIEELIILYPENNALQQIYGIEQDHKWGYTQTTLKELFEKHGFKNVSVLKTEQPHRKGEPKLELTCHK